MVIFVNERIDWKHIPFVRQSVRVVSTTRKSLKYIV